MTFNKLQEKLKYFGYKKRWKYQFGSNYRKTEEIKKLIEADTRGHKGETMKKILG